jgi:hypothetical protein
VGERLLEDELEGGHDVHGLRGVHDLNDLDNFFLSAKRTYLSAMTAGLGFLRGTGSFDRGLKDKTHSTRTQNKNYAPVRHGPQQLMLN